MDARAGTSAFSGRLGRRRLAGSQVCCPQTGRLWGVGDLGLRRATRNPTHVPLVYLYYSVFRVWAGYGGFGI